MTTRDPDTLDRLLEAMSEKVSDAPADRAAYFEGLVKLGEGAEDDARKLFRRASRSCSSPYDALARVAAAQLEARRGKLGMAVRALRALGDDDATPQAARAMAFWHLGVIAQERGEDAQADLDRARALGAPA